MVPHIETEDDIPLLDNAAAASLLSPTLWLNGSRPRTQRCGRSGTMLQAALQGGALPGGSSRVKTHRVATQLSVSPAPDRPRRYFLAPLQEGAS